MTPRSTALADRVRGFRPRRAEGARRAAVALAIVGGEAPAFVLEMRPEALASHAGQYALPGGRIDGSESAVAAALRETEEEIGVPAEQWTVLGELDDYVAMSGTVITPVVIMADGTPEFRPQPAEVAELILLPIVGPVAEPELTPADRQPFDLADAWPAWSITVGGVQLFAPTGAIVHQFLKLAVDGLDVRFAEFREPAFADGRARPAPDPIRRL